MRRAGEEMEVVLEKYHCSLTVSMVDDEETIGLQIILIPTEEDEDDEGYTQQ